MTCIAFTGFIKGKSPSGRAFQLGIPNEEVKQGIMTGLLKHLAHTEKRMIGSDIEKLRTYAELGDVEGLMKHLQSFLAEIPYNLSGKQPEIFYENNLFIIFNLIGIQTKVEIATSFGRMDIMMKCSNFLYIIELKLDKSSGEALQQIIEKEYSLQLERYGLPIIRIGINFSTEKRNIESWRSDRVIISN